MFRSKQRGSTSGGGLFGGLLLFALLYLILVMIDSASCSSKASKMGFNSSYGPLQGCMIEYEPNKYWPIEQVRIVNGKLVLGGEE